MRWPFHAGLFGLALAVRLTYLLEWRDTPLFSVLVGDGRQYDAWAREIAAGNWIGSQVFYQAPLYPYFVALVYSVLGHDLLMLRCVQAVLGSLTCVLVALAGRQFFDTRTGLWAGVLMAFYAPAVYYDGLIQKPVLDALLVSVLLVALGRFEVRRRVVLLLVAGLALGLLALVRENALALPPVVLAWIWVGSRGVPRSCLFRRVAALLAGVAVVLVPVAWRNSAIGGGFLVTTSQAGPNFYVGNHAGADGRYQPLIEGRSDARFERRDAADLAQQALGRRLTPAEVSGYWFGRAFAWIGAKPWSWLTLLAHKAYLVAHAQEIMDTDSIEAYADTSRVLSWLGRFLHFGVLLPLALFGAWATRRDWRRLWLLQSLALVLAGTTVLFYVMGRYRHALIPILVLFAAAGLREAARLVRDRAWRALAEAGLLLGLVAVACNWPLRPSIDPRAITYYSLGAELIEAGRFAQARAQIERTLVLDPAFAEGHFRLGEIESGAGSPAAAAGHYREALRLDPRHARAWVGLGSTEMISGDLDAALADYREALRIDPGDAAAHNNLAVVLVRQGRLPEAVRALGDAIRTNPGDAGVRVNLAKVLLASGDPAGARREVHEALEIDPANAEAREMLAALPVERRP